MVNRSLGYYLNRVYIPAIFIVVISWIPFWLDRDDSHGRVGLGVTTVLTMTTLMANSNAAMQISYLTSLDVFLGVCFAMVFASLIQYAVVGYFETKIKIIDSSEGNHNKMDRLIKKSTSAIDLHSRWIFPLVFIAFLANCWFNWFGTFTD